MLKRTPSQLQDCPHGRHARLSALRAVPPHSGVPGEGPEHGARAAHVVRVAVADDQRVQPPDAAQRRIAGNTVQLAASPPGHDGPVS
jgi:hypothetical protein